MKLTKDVRKYILLFLASLTVFYTMCIFPSGHACEEPSTSPVTAKEYMRNGLDAHASRIELTSWQLNVTATVAIFQELMETEPGLFFVQPRISYAYDENGYITAIYPQYRMNEEETHTARGHLLTYLEDFTASVPLGTCDGDKALWIHDHIAERYKYSPSGEENYDIYSLLRDGHGVCQAFSMMYIILGTCVGLTVDLVTSPSMDHAWNHVEIDGSYYHVDVTRDLSTDGIGYHHDRFLLCDIGIQNKGYRDFSCRKHHACNAHTYEVCIGQQEHLGVMREIVGSSAYAEGLWLSVHPKDGWMTVDLHGGVLSEKRLQNGVDLDRDGMLSLKDLLLLRAYATTEASKSIVSLLRIEILRNALLTNP